MQVLYHWDIVSSLLIHFLLRHISLSFPVWPWTYSVVGTGFEFAILRGCLPELGLQLNSSVTFKVFCLFILMLYLFFFWTSLHLQNNCKCCVKMNYPQANTMLTFTHSVFFFPLLNSFLFFHLFCLVYWLHLSLALTFCTFPKETFYNPNIDPNDCFRSSLIWGSLA